MSDYKALAQMDIRFFTLAYKACPTCGRKFDEMHPAENLYPHWTRQCAVQPDVSAQKEQPK